MHIVNDSPCYTRPLNVSWQYLKKSLQAEMMSFPLAEEKPAVKSKLEYNTWQIPF